MTYRYVDRGYKDTIALIPGWAGDYRIFAMLDLKSNYLLPVEFSPFSFEKDILRALKENNLDRISLLGHSMGAFMASKFAGKFRSMIHRLILVSVRKKYPAAGLEEIRKRLNKSKRGYLYKFYNECFSDSGEMAWFRENLLKKYCSEFDLSYLLNSLDYLEGAEIDPLDLKDIKGLSIIHGEQDKIAPVNEAAEIGRHIPGDCFTHIKDAGHMPFLRKDFSELIW
ncbi:MAG: alpha/beta fold hydrolase [Candidatus Omnitrophica bacterium]|nr:alpha/beta fold hydrolase [Candidatus Omnitrophota bacterium]